MKTTFFILKVVIDLKEAELLYILMHLLVGGNSPRHNKLIGCKNQAVMRCGGWNTSVAAEYT